MFTPETAAVRCRRPETFEGHLVGVYDATTSMSDDGSVSFVMPFPLTVMPEERKETALGTRLGENAGNIQDLHPYAPYTFSGG